MTNERWKLGSKIPHMRYPIGSDFSWVPLTNSEFIKLPQPNRLFTLCRDSIAAICKDLCTTSNHLWIPDYFCPCTVESLNAKGVPILRYKDNPKQKEPSWRSLLPNPNDKVLAVNYFGIRHKETWESWRLENQDVSIIEDHSHDPVSEWALHSQADYAVASLRKTIPIPDGAILWSPSRKVLPKPPLGKDWTGSALKLAAMIFKRDFLEDKKLKDDIFEFQRHLSQQGDELLEKSTCSMISQWSREYLRYGNSKAWRNQREANVRNFIKLWGKIDQSLSDTSLLFRSWPAGHCPFNPVLQFKTLKERNDCRAFLINNKIYAPVHWPDQEILGHDFADKTFLLTIPLDARCNKDDIKRIIQTLKEYFSVSH